MEAEAAVNMGSVQVQQADQVAEVVILVVVLVLQTNLLFQVGLFMETLVVAELMQLPIMDQVAEVVQVLLEPTDQVLLEEQEVLA